MARTHLAMDLLAQMEYQIRSQESKGCSMDQPMVQLASSPPLALVASVLAFAFVRHFLDH